MSALGAAMVAHVARLYAGTWSIFAKAELGAGDGTPSSSRRRFSADRVDAGITTMLVSILALAVGLPAFLDQVPLWPLWLVGTAVLTLVHLLRGVIVEVGADGVLVTSGVGTRSFHGYASLESITVDGAAVFLGTPGEPQVGLELVAPRGEVAARVRALHDAIVGARDAFRKSEQPANVGDLVARGGRSVRDWLDALACAHDARGGFRTSAVPEELLWRLVENPTADASTRAGAAVALRRELDSCKHGRLRAVAQTCASPGLRVALETAADASETELEAVLDALEDGRSIRA